MGAGSYSMPLIPNVLELNLMKRAIYLIIAMLK